MEAMKNQNVRRLTESAVMVALASVLSLLKLVELPYGGAITFASMLPILVIAYRNGLLWGLGSGFVFSVVQLLTGLGTVSMVPGWQSVLAVVMLDYLVAFTVSGLGGIFRKKIKKQATALLLGGLLVSVLRFVCHFITGVTVWKEVSIPADAAIAFSLAYNATYMVPETIVLLTAAWYLGSVLDFSQVVPRRFPAEKPETKTVSILSLVAGLLPVAALVFDIVMIAPHLQDSETAKFTFRQLGDVNWFPIALVSGVAILLSLVYMIFRDRKNGDDGDLPTDET